MNFSFLTHLESREYCEQIILVMMNRHGMSQAEALDTMNEVWVGQDFTGENDVRYHETFDYWADTLLGSR